MLLIKKKMPTLFFLVFAIIAATTYALSSHYLYPAYLGWTFENDLQKQPLFMAIKKIHPKEYSEFINIAKKNLHKKEELELIAQDATLLMNRIFYQHLQQASDDAILSNLKATVELYRYLYTKDPRMILRFENSNLASSVDFNMLWEDPTFQSLLNHLLETKVFIVETPIPQRPLSSVSTDARALLDTIINQLNQKFKEETVVNVFSETGNVSPEIAATVFMDFYSEVIASGKENAGIVMRYLAAKKK